MFLEVFFLLCSCVCTIKAGGVGWGAAEDVKWQSNDDLCLCDK